MSVLLPKTRRRGFGWLALMVLPTSLAGCLGSLPKPPSGRVPPDDMFEVPYPPPPARVQTVPARPKGHDHDVWLDGQWEWVGESWKWTEGYWATPPANAYFTRWTAERKQDGRLFFARATWRDRQGRPVDADIGNGVCRVPPNAAKTAEQAK